MYTMFGSADWFLICGLGSLGQHCVVALKEFEVGVIAIDRVQPQNWEIPNIPDRLDESIWGDCRDKSVLERAKIGQCRAALILTTNEQTNIETALAIRQINPHIRLVIRSSQTNLNRLLSQKLGNCVAYDPTALPAMAFALAALGTTTLGSFALEQQRIQIIQTQVEPGSPWTNLRHLDQFNTPTRRLLAHGSAGEQLPANFHQWEPVDPIRGGDWLVYVEVVDTHRRLDSSAVTSSVGVSTTVEQRQRRKRSGGKHQSSPWWAVLRRDRNWQHQIFQFWQLGLQSQVWRVAVLYGITVLILLAIGTLLFQQYYPGIGLWAAFFDTAILLLGGYGDLFGNFQQLEPIPWWLRVFALGLTIAGTAFVGVLYAILTEALLSSKFQFIQHRPPVPQQDHIVIIGLDRIGQQVAELLQDLRQPLVGMTLGVDVDAAFLPNLSIVTSNLNTALIQANCATAKSVAIVTADEILNLEIALMIQSVNPADPDSHRRLVLRTAGQHLSELLPQILPQAQILDVYRVAAEAFAGAAFGENIIDLFRFNNQTILVTEYQIEVIDTLNGLLLADVAYGYEAMPILHQQLAHPAILLPTDDIRLHVGDRLIVLATIDALRRIEQGRISIKPKSWRLRVDQALTPAAIVEGAQAISRGAGCPVETVQKLMLALPATLPTLLYKHQGQRLVKELRQMQVKAALVPLKKLS
jgi:Trk K+ transport system NAD-binding subunit